MRSLPTLITILGVAAAGLAGLAGCGDDVSPTTCGPGTTERGHECVPDGSIICEQGTRFDPATSKCEVDPSACADGTVLVEGVCVPEDDTLTADHDERAEPNDETGAGQLSVPAMNASTSIHGCITPRNGAADDDIWILETGAPAVLEITADGVGGLAAGFAVFAYENERLANYRRIGLNLTGDTSKRQVYLPAAGTYLLLMADSRTVLTGEAAGGTDTCYYTTIKQVALPSATPLSLPVTAGTDSGNVRVLTYTPGQVGDIFDVTQTTTSETMEPAFIVRKNGAFYASAATVTAAGQPPVPPYYTLGGLTATDTIDVIVDEIINYSLTAQPYAIDAFDIGATALPTDGTAITLTKHNGQTPSYPYVDSNYSYFDVPAAGQVVYFDIASSAAVRMRIVRQDIFTPEGTLDIVVGITTGTATTRAFARQYVRFAQPGRYYLVTLDPAGTADQTYTLTSSVAANTPTPITYGAAMAAQPLPAHGAAFYTLDLSDAHRWIELGVPAATNWGGNARISLYDVNGIGWLDNGFNNIQRGSVPVDGSRALGRVTAGAGQDFLVRVDATATPGATPSFDLLVRDRSDVTTVQLTPGTPITRNGDALLANGTRRYLVVGPAGAAVQLSATPTDAAADIRIARLNRTEGSAQTSDAGDAGAAETLNAIVTGAEAVLALTIATDATATNLDPVTFAAAAGAYNAAPGMLAMTDACAGGTTIMTAADDEVSAALTLPAGFATFPYFGASSGGTVVVSSNGWLTFDGSATNAAFTNAAMPTAGDTNAVVAPYWDDLAEVTICRKDEAARVTFQWTGTIYGGGPPVRFQAVLNSNGRIDFLYGPTHGVRGEGATIGIENADGTAAIPWSFNGPGVTGGRSLSFTPAS